MPRGNPNAQTIATEKYQKKMGYISKSFKLRKELVDEFSKKCEEKGVSQAKVLSEMMTNWINAE